MDAELLRLRWPRSVRYLTNDSGTVTDTYDYDAFGILIDHTGSTHNRYMYCGEQFDSDLGFYYLRARYMNPRTGRFMTMDSYEGVNDRPMSLHKYLYADATPVNGNDPSGHMLLKFAITTAIQATLAAAIGGVIFAGDAWLEGKDPDEIEDAFYSGAAAGAALLSLVRYQLSALH
jgi:RHS repeat-associated protein